MIENKNFRILVVDDDLDFLAVAEHKLSMRGFQVTTSALNEAIKVVKNSKVDFIFMDINKTSTEGAAILKHVSSLNSKPVIQYFGMDSNHTAATSELFDNSHNPV